MKNKFKILLSVLTATVLTTATVFGAVQTGKLINGSTMIPLRGVFEELGFTVSWNGATNKATLKDDDYTIILEQNNKTYTVNGVEYQSTVAPQVISGSTYIPLRTLGDKIGAVTVWDGTINTAYITYNEVTSEILVDNTTKNNTSSTNSQKTSTVTETKNTSTVGADYVKDDPKAEAPKESTVSSNGRTFSNVKAKEQYEKAKSLGITDAQYDNFVANGIYNAQEMKTCLDAGDANAKLDVASEDAQGIIDQSDSYKLSAGTQWK